MSWDPPVGNFVYVLPPLLTNAGIDRPRISRLPLNEDGEWWELSDESRGGLPYYYQTKTGETVWERPEGFVIPLGIIQVRVFGFRNDFNPNFGFRILL